MTIYIFTTESWPSPLFCYITVHRETRNLAHTVCIDAGSLTLVRLSELGTGGATI